jgi:hypothetical protein
MQASCINFNINDDGCIILGYWKGILNNSTLAYYTSSQILDACN